MVARKRRESSSSGRGWEQPMGGWSCAYLAVHHSSGVAFNSVGKFLRAVFLELGGCSLGKSLVLVQLFS